MSASKNVAIIGGGITGATAAWKLSKYHDLTIHVFDQGRRGPGGRASSRSAVVTGAENDDDDDGGDDDANKARFDHGCQFFRADTPRFRDIVSGEDWGPFVKKWRGRFASSESLSSEKEFFGLPSTPPFYVASDGMQSLPKNVLQVAGERLTEPSSSSTSLRVFEGTRVAQLEQDSGRWRLRGTSGTAAFHDTPESKAKQDQNGTNFLGDESGYDAVVLTDVSSSFGSWHRASAGVPEEYAGRVRRRVGARVPLFSAMVAFDRKTKIPFDAASFDDPIVWFAARPNSKPGMEDLRGECWTIVSTPEYAMEKIEETPMQDPTTGEFIPQSGEYLTSVPGPDLCNASKSSITRRDGVLGEEALEILPEVVHVDAQRWGSALPCHLRSNNDDSPTRRVISGVAYDSGRFALAPTEAESDESFLADEGLMLFQAGDMVSGHTPGLEGAALSGHDAAERVHRVLRAS